MTASTVEVFAPATMANLGVGFDVLGLAVCEPGDIVRAVRTDTPGAAIADVTGDEGRLTRDPRRNTASVAAQCVLDAIGATEGVALTLLKGLPLGSGLGSSAASAVAGALAANAAFGGPLPREDLLACCMEGEAVASGYHADNIAPCLFGGIVMVTGLQPDMIFRLPVPDRLHLALVTPHVEVLTAAARAVLPKHVPLQTMVRQTAQIARLVDALHRGDVEAMAAAMEADSVVEPARAHLMPHIHEVRAAARRAGALALVISGAGPTLAAVCDAPDTALRVADAMRAVYDEAGVASTARATRVAEDGARVVSG